MSSTPEQVWPREEGATASFVPYTRWPGAERTLEGHLGKAGSLTLPPGWTDNVVRAVPWALLLGMPPLSMAAFASLFFGALSASDLLASTLSLLFVALSGAALPGLFRRNQVGWARAAYAMCLLLLKASWSLSLVLVAAAGLGLWLLFQTKSCYAGGATAS